MLVKHSPESVMHLTQKLGLGGLERTIVSLAAAARATGSKQTSVFVYDDTRQSAALLGELERLKVPFRLGQKVAGFSWATVREIRAACEEDGVRVLHTHDLNALLYGVLVKLSSWGRIRIVHTQHTFLHLHSRKQALYERIFPRWANLLVVPARSLADTYRRLGYPVTRLREVPNPIPINPPTSRISRDAALVEWAGQVAGAGDSLAKLASLRGDRWVLVLGRVHPGKGQEAFLEAWPLLDPALRSRLRVLFVGPSADAAFRARLETRARSLPDGERLLWFQAVADPRPCFVAADVFVSLSAFEGSPLAPVEAFGAGCPVVLSDIPGHRDLGLPGAVFVPIAPLAETARALGEAIARAVPPSLAAREELRHQRDPTNVARAYAELYAEVLSGVPS